MSFGFNALLSGVAWAAGPQLSAEAMNNFSAQVQTLMAAKAALTPAQKKINSNIVRYLHTKVLKDQVETLPQLQTSVELNSKNEILTRYQGQRYRFAAGGD